MQTNTDNIYIETFPIDRFHKSDWHSVNIRNSKKQNYGFVKIIKINDNYKFLKMNHFDSEFFCDKKMIIKNKLYNIIKIEQIKNELKDGNNNRK